MHESPNLAGPWAAFARYDAENGGEQRRVGGSNRARGSAGDLD